MRFSKRLLLLVLIPAAILAVGGCAQDEESPLIEQPIISGDDNLVDRLLTYQHTMLGESSVIKELLREDLPGAICLASFDITLNRLSIEYEPTERSGMTEADFKEYWTESVTRQIIFYNSSALFALIENLESVQYNIAGYELPTFTISKEAMDEFYGDDLKTISTREDWQRLIIENYLDSSRIEHFFETHPLSKPLDA